MFVDVYSMLKIMKTKLFAPALIIAMIMLLHTATCSAQWQLGVVGGENFANAQTLPSPFPNSTAKGGTGYVLGIRSDQDFMPKVNLQFELLLTARSFNDDIGSQSWVEHVMYLQIPILLKYNPLEGAVQPYAVLGPDIGFRISATLDSNSIIGLNRATLFNGIDLNIDAGLGVQFKIVDDVSIFGEARYTYGLLNVYNNSQSGSYSGDLRARDFSVLAGLMFSIY